MSLYYCVISAHTMKMCTFILFWKIIISLDFILTVSHNIAAAGLCRFLHILTIDHQIGEYTVCNMGSSAGH